MLHIRFYFYYFFIVVLIFVWSPSLAQQSPRDSILQIDPAIRSGKLPNGLSYFIRRNSDPANTISMHLVVKAGYEQETLDQLELAHLLEHMAFVTTEHFDDPYAFFDSKGIRRGININAHTSFNSTSYDIEIPSGNVDLIEHSLLFLRDCAHGIILNDDDIEVQRSPIIRELSGKINIGSDMEHDYLKRVYQNPMEKSIGERIDNLRKFKKESLVKFYRNWYRSDLQAIVIVGDVDENDIEKRIQTFFADLDNVADLKLNTPFENKKDTSISNVIVVANEKTDQVGLLLTIDHPYKVANTIETFRRDVICQIFNSMMNRRLSRVNIPGADTTINTINIAFGNRHLMGSDFFSLRIQATLSSAHIEEGFKKSVRHLREAWMRGFVADEFDNAQQELKKSFMSTDESSSGIARDIGHYFVNGDVVLSGDTRRVLLDQVLGELSLAEINKEVKDMVANANPDIAIFIPEFMKEILTPDILKTWLEDVRIEKTSQRSFPPPNLSLMESGVPILEEGASVELSEYIKDARITHLRLSNGMNIYVRFKSKRSVGDLIFVHGFKHFIKPLDERHSALRAMAASLVGRSGLGSLNSVQLSTLWAERGGGLRPYCGTNGAEISGAIAEKNVEYLLQAIYLYLNDPRIDEHVFREMVERMRESDGNPKTAGEILSEEMNKQRGNWYRGITDNEMSTISSDSLLGLFNNAFKCADRYNFVISGVSDSTELMHLIDRYFARIQPGDGASPLGIVDSRFEKPNTNVNKVLQGARKGSAQVTMIYTDDQRYDDRRYLETRLLARLLQARLMYRLRDVHGGTYYVSVRCNAYEYPTSRSSITISFECDDKQYAQMMGYVGDEIRLIRSGRINVKDFKTALEIERQTVEAELTTDIFWLKYLVSQIQINKYKLAGALTWTSRLKKVRALNLQKAAKRCLTLDNLSSFVVIPPSEN